MKLMHRHGRPFAPGILAAVVVAMTCGGGPPPDDAPSTSDDEPACRELGCPCLSFYDCDIGLCLDDVCSCDVGVTGCPCVAGECAAGFECVDELCVIDETPECGDGFCAAGESCHVDCGPPGDYFCGDGVCDSGEICPKDCGGPVCGDGECAVGESCAVDCMPACMNHPLGMAPFGPPPYFCGAAGPLTLAIFSDINEFWGSALVPCVCGPDSPAGPYCVGNAFAATVLSALFGYVYYDPNKLAELQAFAGGSVLAPAWFLAHEVGHNVQAAYGIASPYTIYQELGADCLSGYFMGWLACIGAINENDVNGTLVSVCSTQDPIGTPWFDPTAHGTCQDRVNSTMWGMSAYFNGTPPHVACTP